jgi:single-strand DNA-binding protein
MSLEITGTLIKLYEEKVFNSTRVEGGFRVREFVIRTHDNFPQEIVFQLTQNKIELLNSVQLNSEIRVKFNLKGRESNGRHYNSLDAWALDSAASNGGSVVSNPSQISQSAAPAPVLNNNNPSPESEEDLPF